MIMTQVIRNKNIHSQSSYYRARNVGSLDLKQQIQIQSSFFYADLARGPIIRNVDD
jgi:hypothetical protein